VLAFLVVDGFLDVRSASGVGKVVGARVRIRTQPEVIALSSDISDILKIVDLREGKIWDAGGAQRINTLI
jgi:hypothetical protein